MKITKPLQSGEKEEKGAQFNDYLLQEEFSYVKISLWNLTDRVPRN